MRLYVSYDKINEFLPSGAALDSGILRVSTKDMSAESVLSGVKDFNFLAIHVEIIGVDDEDVLSKLEEFKQVLLKEYERLRNLLDAASEKLEVKNEIASHMRQA